MKSKGLLILTIGLMGTMMACTGKKGPENPFLGEYKTPFGVPPFDKIKVEHYEPAIAEGIKQQLSEIDAITANAEAPTFENTIIPLDYSGELLERVVLTMENINSANTSDELQEVLKKVSPMLSKHRDDISMNPKLFERVKVVYENMAQNNYTPEQKLLIEKTYKSFVRGGANLDSAKQAELRDINQKLSLLALQFNENLLAENNDYFIVIDKEEDLAGLPESVKAMGAEEAKSRGMEGKWVYTIYKPSMIPFLTYAQNKELRDKLYYGYYMRGNNNNAHDNKNIIKQIVDLRQKKAELLGYPTHAHYVLDVNMAKVPENVYNLLNKLWEPALKRAKAERDDMQKLAKAEGAKYKIGPADWWYYAEKVRKAKYDLDEEMLRPYLSLDAVRSGIFNLTEKLYGLKYVKRTDLPVYHPECEVYEVQEADGKHVGILYLDFFPRESKSVGAWCTEYRSQRIMPDGKFISPVVSIVCNFSKPTGNSPALLSYDEAETFYHEFGHALHALFSKVQYPGLRNVPRDFVELPSQIMEHWAGHKQYLKEYARHYQTGEPMPDELINKIEASGHFNQGFATTEYLAASILDMDYHTLTADKAKIEDVVAFEKASMDKIGLIPEIWPRYRSTYFAHIFSDVMGYSSGYYSYIWAEVLDSDAFEAFVESGDIFNKEIAGKFRTCVLEKGGSKDAMELYKDFRGKEPSIEPLLKNRGLN
ncbi:MAG: M3 family metallopeptidase [Tenuifilum sp.]|uniref:M3 family metallopeptidase n=1 Tax=Tenuifilum sp. TaxID=2760880 RepID=UPI001B450F00|nr:M3 family metallopeptidase [Bacteroidales bacterium]HOK60908.1 M3 family metallopeptidase [Tenuifilum sp.]MBP9029731.1 M3 family metallopeptidase [Bacteroidales bacterium]HOK86096.1 M3 family metallopeptidase [Tenuifilum sp.]HON70901.1 M3 family metallopeptidase [Tenuifilum sp.]